MSKKKKEIDINTIDLKIQAIQLEKFLDDFDKAMGLKKKFLNIALFIIPLLLSIIGSAIFKAPIIMIIGAGLSSTAVVATMTKDLNKEIDSDFKKYAPEHEKNTPNFQNSTKSVEEVLRKDKIVKSEEFYSPEFKHAIEKIKSTTPLSSQEPNEPILEVLDTELKNLSKEETMMQLVKEIDTYKLAYKLPPLKISNKQWETFFDITYSFFVQKGIEKKFYTSISEIGKFVYAKAMVENNKNITIYIFIDNLNYLKFQEKNLIKKQEIESLQKELHSKLYTSNKVVNFSDYTTPKKRK